CRNQEPRLAPDKREGLPGQRFHPQRAVESKSRIAFSSLQAPKRLSRHHLSHDKTLQWARRQAIGENDKLIKIPATTLVLRRNIARIPVRRDGAVLDAPVTRAHFPLTLSINFP